MRPMIHVASVLGDYAVEFSTDMTKIETLVDATNTITFIDRNVEILYPSLHRKNNVVVDCVEGNKTLEMANIILQKMIARGVRSNWNAIIIGGGILQDVAGFCCSIYNRGISYTYIPTTLLAQADSCIGGKTSINFDGKKNIIGSFFPPRKILINTQFLNTLSRLDYISGLGEVYKFHILQNNIAKFDDAIRSSAIEQTIYESLAYKNSILRLDEFDKKERKFLNFGHTFGHALEYTSANAVPHGIAVVAGSVISSVISHKLGYHVPHIDLIRYQAHSLLRGIQWSQHWFNYTDIMEAVKLDKKNTGDIVDVLLNETPQLTVLTNTDVIREALVETFQLFT